MSEEKIPNKQKKFKIAKLLEDVNSGVETKVTSALDSLQVYGDISIIEPLIQSLDLQQAEKCKQEILEFLSSLKSSAAIQIVMDCLDNPTFKHQRIAILSTIWNSPLDYSNHLARFIELAVKEEFLVTLECLTIIENLEGPFDESATLEGQLLLKEYYEGKFPKDAQKDQLISEIAILVKDMDRSIDD